MESDVLRTVVVLESCISLGVLEHREEVVTMFWHTKKRTFKGSQVDSGKEAGDTLALDLSSSPSPPKKSRSPGFYSKVTAPFQKPTFHQGKHCEFVKSSSLLVTSANFNCSSSSSSSSDSDSDDQLPRRDKNLMAHKDQVEETVPATADAIKSITSDPDIFSVPKSVGSSRSEHSDGFETDY